MGQLTGAGATFPQPVIEAWAYEYYKLTKVKINYQGILKLILKNKKLNERGLLWKKQKNALKRD